MKTKKEITDKIKEIRRVEGRCFANAEVAGGWLDALEWVLQQEACSLCQGTGIMPGYHNTGEYYKED